MDNNNLPTANYRMKLNRAPNVEYRVQSVMLPGMSLGTAYVPTPFTQLPMPGNIAFDDLQLSFLVGSKFEDYLEIYRWMIELGQPERLGSYPEKNKDAFSDGSLFILDSSYTEIATVKFIDLYPVSLSSIEFNSTNQTVEYAHASVTFKYTRFEINT